MKDYTVFEKKIGVTFVDKDLLINAFTHRSYINEHASSGLEHNERLEFLGDAVLELVTTHELFVRYPHTTEGELTAYRASLVNTVSIAETGEALGMNEYLLLSKGEARDTGKARSVIIADTFEALIGAMYLDQGYEVARDFIIRHLMVKIDIIVEKKLWRDGKSLLQEKAQEYVGVTPQYRIIDEKGPDHDKHFTSGVYVGPELLAQGRGKSKQEAEQDAARRALEVKKWL
jgi:ribonuclease III